MLCRSGHGGLKKVSGFKVCVGSDVPVLWQGGQPVSCPLRCAPPERVVANSTVRALVALAQAAPPPGCAHMLAQRQLTVYFSCVCGNGELQVFCL